MLTQTFVSMTSRIVSGAALAALLAQPLAAAETRNLILLPDEERLHVLEEMRGLLATVSATLDAANANDMDRLASTARAAGMASTKNTPASLPAKLPVPFKQMGMQVHRAFDQIALDAQSLRDRDHALGQLAKTLQLCVACHAAYGFGTAPPQAVGTTTLDLISPSAAIKGPKP